MNPSRLTVLYDGDCALCVRCHHWLATQPTYVTLDFLAAGSRAARKQFGSVPWLGAELIVVNEATNDVWVGAAAFLMCLWATRRYREWSYRLSGTAFAPLAESFFLRLSKNRGRIGSLLGTPDCPDGQCRHRRSTARPVGA